MGISEWRDEHPDRYGPFGPGDRCVVTFLDGVKHFVLVADIRYGADRDAYGYHAYRDIDLADRAECGCPTGDYEANRQRMGMGGIVNCPDCLQAFRDAQMNTREMGVATAAEA